MIKLENMMITLLKMVLGVWPSDAVFNPIVFNLYYLLCFSMLCWEVIVRRANLQTTGTIYYKETQLLASYADDIDIVGRSYSAVRNAYLALEGEAAKVVINK
jgi:hypothetical protein